MQEHILARNHLIDIQVKRWSFNPFHVKDWVTPSCHQDAFRRISETGQNRDRIILKMSLNCAVPLIAIAEVTTKASDCIVRSRMNRVKFVDVRELPGGNQRHSQAINC